MAESHPPSHTSSAPGPSSSSPGDSSSAQQIEEVEEEEEGEVNGPPSSPPPPPPPTTTAPSLLSSHHQHDDPRIISLIAPQSVSSVPHRIVIRTSPPVLREYPQAIAEIVLTREREGEDDSSSDDEDNETISPAKARLQRRLGQMIHHPGRRPGQKKKKMKKRKNIIVDVVVVREEEEEEEEEEDKQEKTTTTTQEFSSCCCCYSCPENLRTLEDFVDRRPHHHHHHPVVVVVTVGGSGGGCGDNFLENERLREILRGANEEKIRKQRVLDGVKWELASVYGDMSEEENEIIEEESEVEIVAGEEKEKEKEEEIEELSPKERRNRARKQRMAEEEPLDLTSRGLDPHTAEKAAIILQRAVIVGNAKARIARARKRQIHRERACTEFVKTEDALIDKMIFFRGVYEKALLKNGYGSFARNVFTDFDPLIETLKRFKDELVKTLVVLPLSEEEEEEEMEEEGEEHNKPTTASPPSLTPPNLSRTTKTRCWTNPYGAFNRSNQLGSVMLSMADDLLEKYLKFVSHQASCLNEEEEKKRSDPRRFPSLLDDIQRKGNCLPLQSYLMEPVMRIPRYRLLTAAILKTTDAEISDRECLEEAYQKYSSMADSLNQSIDKSRSYLVKFIEPLIHDVPYGYCLHSTANERKFVGSIGRSEPDPSFDLLPGASLVEGLPVVEGEEEKEEEEGGEELFLRPPCLILVFSTCLVLSKAVVTPLSVEDVDEVQDSENDSGQSLFRFECEMLSRNVRIEVASVEKEEEEEGEEEGIRPKKKKNPYPSTFSINDLSQQDKRVTITCSDPRQCRAVMRVLCAHLPENGAHKMRFKYVEKVTQVLSPENFALACPVPMSGLECVQFLQNHQVPLVQVVFPTVTTTGKKNKRPKKLLYFCSIDRTGNRLLFDDGAGDRGVWRLDEVQRSVFGVRTREEVFRGCLSLGRLCFTLIFRSHQELYFVCLSRRDQMIWDRALSHVIDEGTVEAFEVPDVEFPQKSMRNLYLWGENSSNAFGFAVPVVDVVQQKQQARRRRSRSRGSRRKSRRRSRSRSPAKKKKTTAEEQQQGQEEGKPPPHFPTPTIVKRMMSVDVASVSLGANATFPLVRTADECRVFAFGSGFCGKLGHGSNFDNDPQVVLALNDCDVVSVSCGSAHTLFLEKNGHVWSCGAGEFGQLGVGVTKGAITTPARIAFSWKFPVSFVAAGGDHSVLVTRSGDLYSFGKNTYGQLGLGDARHRTQPALVSVIVAGGGEEEEEEEGEEEKDSGGVKFRAAALGFCHTLALTTNGEVYAWGGGTKGQLGDGQLGEEHQSLVPVKCLIPLDDGDDTVVQIASGEYHCVVRTESGKVFVWGDGKHGQLGIAGLPGRGQRQEMEEEEEGETISSTVLPKNGVGTTASFLSTPTELVFSPKKVFSPPRLSNPICVQIACGSHHTLALMKDRSPEGRKRVVSWGYGASGRLGHGSFENHFTPKEIAFFSQEEKGIEVIQIAAGAYASGAIVVRHSCIRSREWETCMRCGVKTVRKSLRRSRLRRICCVCGGVFCRACTVKLTYPVVWEAKKGPRLLGKGRLCLGCQETFQRHCEEE